MREVLLCYVAVPCNQDVLNIINLFSLNTNTSSTDILDAPGCALFLYNSTLELEGINKANEWVIGDEHVLDVLTLYANQDFKGVCNYLNNIPKRPFNVFAVKENSLLYSC